MVSDDWFIDVRPKPPSSAEVQVSRERDEQRRHIQQLIMEKDRQQQEIMNLDQEKAEQQRTIEMQQHAIAILAQAILAQAILAFSPKIVGTSSGHVRDRPAAWGPTALSVGSGSLDIFL